MNEYQQIERATKIKLVTIGSTMAKLSREMGISQQLLYKYMKGRAKHLTPVKLMELVNDAISRL